MQKPFTPKRYFSIDRVFRNEAVDRTHLAEFHQIEGNWQANKYEMGWFIPIQRVLGLEFMG